MTTVSKRPLRAAITRGLRKLTRSMCAEQSKRACEHLMQTQMWSEAANICLYLPPDPRISRIIELDMSLLLERTLQHFPTSWKKKLLYACHVCPNQTLSENGNPTQPEMIMVELKSLNDIDMWSTSNWGIRYAPEEVLAQRSIWMPGRSISDDSTLILAPGVAFSQTGRRCGRGGGYFDRYLRYIRIQEAKPCKHRKQVKTRFIGMCFSVQMVPDEHIPMNEQDVWMDAVVTPETIYSATC